MNPIPLEKFRNPVKTKVNVTKKLQGKMQTTGRTRITTTTQRPQIIPTKEPVNPAQSKGPSSNPSPPSIILDKKQKSQYSLAHFLGEVILDKS